MARSSVCFISLIRLCYLYFGVQATDITQDVAGVSMWSAIELNVAIVCACLMVMKPLVARLFPRLCLENAESYPFSYARPPAISDRFRAGPLHFSETATATTETPREVSLVS